MDNSSSASQRASISVQALFGFLSFFAALCTIFAFVVTAAEAWREHAQLSWPSATATIQRCAVDTYVRSRNGNSSTRSRIACDIQYVVNDNDIQARLHSASAASNSDVSLMRRWVGQHARGTDVAIHYDPANSKNAVLTETDMPFAGPHTPNNLKLLAIAVVAFVVFYSLARILQRRQTSASAVP